MSSRRQRTLGREVERLQRESEARAVELFDPRPPDRAVPPVTTWPPPWIAVPLEEWVVRG